MEARRNTIIPGEKHEFTNLWKIWDDKARVVGVRAKSEDS